MKLDKTSARIDSARSGIVELGEAVKSLEGEIAEAVAAAIQVLKSYYEGAFIQLASKTTLKSKAKKSDIGGTIISILENAEAEFTKMLAEANTDEEAAASAFTKLANENK